MAGVGLLSEYFSHFVLWNAGNGPAIEIKIALLRSNELDRSLS